MKIASTFPSSQAAQQMFVRFQCQVDLQCRFAELEADQQVRDAAQRERIERADLHARGVHAGHFAHLADALGAFADGALRMLREHIRGGQRY